MLSSTTDTADMLDTAAAAARAGFGYATFIRLRAAGQTPPPDVFRGKRAHYRPETIDAWLQARGGKKTWRLVPGAGSQA